MADEVDRAGEGRVIDEAAPGERQQVADLLVRAFSAHTPHMPTSVADAYLAEVADIDSRSGYTELLVARSGGRIAGSVTFVPDASSDGHPWPAHGSVIRLLAVDPTTRGLGLGRFLVAECIERSRRAGRRFIALHTAAFMTEASALYESMGFVRAPEWDFEASRYYGSPASPPVRGIAYLLDISGRRGRRVALAAEPASVPAGRRLVRDVLASAGAFASEQAELAASELLTNALLHGEPPISLEVRVDGSRARITVFDVGSATLEAPALPGSLTTFGRGLNLVSRLADAWGVDRMPAGKAVWFELELPH